MEQHQPRSNCPVSFLLDILGDRWTLLVIRDMVFDRKRHFRKFLASDEGIATNILTSRLRLLEVVDIICRRTDQDNSRQVIYTLTEEGLDLVPVLVDLIVWGGKYGAAEIYHEFLQRVKRARRVDCRGASAGRSN
ncbi:MAG: helix-turn-helix domain-containing protein [Candidatus Thiodiazotropha sp.]